MSISESAVAVVSVSPFCLTRQDAIAFCGVKDSYFDEQLRPGIRELRAGTSTLFLREELEDAMRRKFGKAKTAQDPRSEPVAEEQDGKKPWERKQPASTKTALDAGKSTRSSTAYDFTNALTALKKQKRG